MEVVVQWRWSFSGGGRSVEVVVQWRWSILEIQVYTTKTSEHFLHFCDREVRIT